MWAFMDATSWWLHCCRYKLLTFLDPDGVTNTCRARRISVTFHHAHGLLNSFSSFVLHLPAEHGTAEEGPRRWR